MLLSELVPDEVAVPAAATAITINGLASDSRVVAPGFLFAALADVGPHVEVQHHARPPARAGRGR